MALKDIVEEKNGLVDKVAEKDRKFIEMAVDAVIKHFEGIEEKSGSEGEMEGCGYKGRVCPAMVAEKECTGMPFVDEARIRQVLDVMYSEGFLERKIPEGTGVPHYFQK